MRLYVYAVLLALASCSGGTKTKKGMNIYEVNVRQYTAEGTFAAFQQNLPRLKEMGVEVVWLMPVYPIGLQNRKGRLGSYYSIKDYTAVNPEFGSLDDFKALVKEAHRLGMKVIIDWVANHTSWDHPWVLQHPDFYAKDSSGQLFSPFDWSDVVQLDHKSAAQQDAMIGAMQFWVEQGGIDGFRCDMAHLAPLEFWQKAQAKLHAIKPLFWLAETQDTPYYKAFNVIYGWEWLHKMEDYYKGNTQIAGLDSIINYYMLDYRNNKFRILFTTNHDENSWQGTEFDRLGNAARPFAVLCATLPGIPLVYSGQEEPLRKKLEFFNKDNIDFKTYSWQPFYKTLLDLRAANPALQPDSSAQYIRLHTSADDKIFSFLRKKDAHEVLVIANLSAMPASIQLPDERVSGSFKNVFTGNMADLNAQRSFNLDAWGMLVFSK